MKKAFSLISNLFSKVKLKINNFNARRELNSTKYTMTNRLLVLLFPVFIVCMAEINQAKYLSKFILFVVNKPLVMVFNILMASLIYYAILLISKRGWLAMLSVGFTYFLLSTVELFKYGTNGNHLILTDMRLVKNTKSLTSFAYTKITPQLVIYTVIVFAFIAAGFWFNPKINLKFSKRISAAFMCIATCLSIVVVPSISMPVYSFFDIDTTESSNAFKLNEKFDNNSFLAFFVQTTSENLSNKLVEPDEYEYDVVDNYLNDNAEIEARKDFANPNVIMIMSEAFADFRVFDELNLDINAYDGFDWVAEKGYKGTAIVPTFASFTVRTEFELNFGLPVRSLKDPNMPQRLLQLRDQPTIARMYKDMGYSTVYIHPFLSSFYSRDTKYAYFDYDTMIFQDDFTVDVDYFTSYISDEVVFNQIYQLVKDTDEPIFIHTTTMQNHQPYNQGENPDDELGNYLAGIKYTCESLKVLVESLDKLDEPTVLVMVGDHFPSFRGEDNIYEMLGINGDNCSIVYEQPYVIWSNYELNYNLVPDEKISTFYMPYIIMDLIGAPKNEFVVNMLKKMDEVPVYSTNHSPDVPNDDELDILTYDRIIGNIYSDKEVMDEESE